MNSNKNIEEIWHRITYHKMDMWDYSYASYQVDFESPWTDNSVFIMVLPKRCNRGEKNWILTVPF